jgi:LysM repeat protein
MGVDRPAHYHAHPVARILAVSALVIAAVVVIVVVSSSLGGSSENSTSHANGPNKQKEHHDKYYVVQPGDTFAGIADKEGFSVQHLEELNKDRNLDTQILPEQGCINLVPDGCKILAKRG